MYIFLSPLPDKGDNGGLSNRRSKGQGFWHKSSRTSSTTLIGSGVTSRYMEKCAHDCYGLETSWPVNAITNTSRWNRREVLCAGMAVINGKVVINTGLGSQRCSSPLSLHGHQGSFGRSVPGGVVRRENYFGVTRRRSSSRRKSVAWQPMPPVFRFRCRGVYKTGCRRQIW